MEWTLTGLVNAGIKDNNLGDDLVTAVNTAKKRLSAQQAQEKEVF